MQLKGYSVFRKSTMKMIKFILSKRILIINQQLLCTIEVFLGYKKIDIA